ncbi:MAG TPA: KH domain-containing protein [Thermoanaerobaculia bacterium]|nr:KH domain-containing protein [Thermoanaerobaculia bacterium]
MPDLAADVKELARLLVDHPEQVEVAEVQGRRDRGTLLELRVAPDDLGKVIGRQGRTARALRTLLETHGDRTGQRYELEIIED